MRFSTRCTLSLIPIALLSFGAFAGPVTTDVATQSVGASTSASSQLDAAVLSRVQAKLVHAQAVANRLAEQAAALGYADNAWRYELINHLMKADKEAFTRIEATADLASALQAASAAAASADQALPKVLGDTTDDLVYTPITPCRIVDTRGAGAGGAFAGRETRTYTYAGSAAQGGTACVPTTVTPDALAVNVTIQSTGLGESSSTTGFLSVIPQGGNPTATSWMNFTGNQIEANAGVATINQSNGEFSVFAQIPTQVIVDVFGVLRPPLANGTLNHLTKWTPNANTLGTSTIVDNGNIGIGTSTPTSLLQIGDTADLGSFDFAIGDGTASMAFDQLPGASLWVSTTNFVLLPTLGAPGMVGIGTLAPAFTLDIASAQNTQINLTGDGGVTATLSRYTNRFEIEPSDGFQVSVGEVASPDLWVGSNHKVGIGTTMPANALQIGSIGSVNFNGNQIAFGDGTDASAFAQTTPSGPTPSVAWWFSTTNIALMPQVGRGFVGINTTTPTAPLEVDDAVTLTGDITSFFDGASGLITCNCTSSVSIHSAGDIYATGFDAYSDARIKNIHGASNSAQDLDALNSIEVTDYTMKDKIKYGNMPFKKVIAQQVETVYPQVVSKHADFIPNVYQLTSKIEPADGGYILSFKNPHGLSKTAKKLKLLTEGTNTMQQVEIVATPSDHDVVVKASGWTAERAFVYGEQVDDFRTVDYDGLTALNISATQELGKQLLQQQLAMRASREDKENVVAQLKDKETEIAGLRNELASQRTRVAALENRMADVAELKAQLISLQQSRGALKNDRLASQP